MSNPITPATPNPESPVNAEADLLAAHGARWTIEYVPPLHVWMASRESADRRHRRVVVGRSPAELHAKLDVIEAGQ